VFDIDDGVMVKCDLAGAWRMAWWDPDRVLKILRMADTVIVGSHALEEFAREHTDKVTLIPTGVPDDQFVEPSTLTGAFRDDVPCVGWIGTSGNLRFLQEIVPQLEQVAAHTPFTLLVVGGPNMGGYDLGSLHVERVTWTARAERGLLQRMDIGLMPLPDEEWSRYKCSYKMLQYMASGAVVLASPVGENAVIVRSEVNGLLCSEPVDWTRSLERVLSDQNLRARLTRAARDSVAAYALSGITANVADVVARTERTASGDSVGATRPRS
jgi:glycosyltransferase involved in cell wall biosynthesis